MYTPLSEKYAIFDIAESRVFLAPQNAQKLVCLRAASGPTAGVYCAPPDTPAAFDGPTSKRGG